MAGDLAPAGTEMVDGVELQKYVQPPRANQAQAPCLENEDPGVCANKARPYMSPLDSSTWTVWVDPATGRVVKEQVTGASDPDYDTTTTDRYLERTPENLAQFELRIPDGFREVEEMSRAQG